jgi:hypothetical protein
LLQDDALDQNWESDYTGDEKEVLAPTEPKARPPMAPAAVAAAPPDEVGEDFPEPTTPPLEGDEVPATVEQWHPPTVDAPEVEAPLEAPPVEEEPPENLVEEELVSSPPPLGASTVLEPQLASPGYAATLLYLKQVCFIGNA